MKMYTRSFDKIVEAEAWVNKNHIPQDKIVNIFSSADGTFQLVYFGED